MCCLLNLSALQEQLPLYTYIHKQSFTHCLQTLLTSPATLSSWADVMIYDLMSQKLFTACHSSEHRFVFSF